jgi:hypothetical protein
MGSLENSVEMLIIPDSGGREVRFTIGSKILEDINCITADLGFGNLEGYAREAPDRVYRILILYASGHEEVEESQPPEINGNRIDTTDMDGSRASAGLGRYAIRQLAMQPELFPVDTVVAVWDDEQDVSRVSELFRFHVAQPAPI